MEALFELLGSLLVIAATCIAIIFLYIWSKK